MSKRPRIKIPLNAFDKVLEIAGWIGVGAIWLLVKLSYEHLPDIIAIHYDATGTPDNFGGKGTLFTLPILATILYVGLTILNRFPHVFNYPTKITEENALMQYTSATKLIRWLKFAVVLLFSLIAYQTVRSSKGETDGLGACFLPFTLFLMFFPIAIYLVKSLKKR